MVAAKPFFTATAADLKTIARENGTCRVGSAATISDLMDSSLLGDIIPHMARFMALIASEPIRNLATVGGNIVNASPIGDPAIIFLALKSRVVLKSKSEERTLPLKAFFKGYKELDLQPGELLAAVVFDLPAKRNEFYFNFEKVGKRRRLDIASVNSAIALEMEGGVIKKGALAAGGVAPVPLFLSGASACMAGKALTVETVGAVATAALEEISPISDIRGSAAYKRLLLRQLIWAHFQRLFPSEIPMEELP
jgi:xanthine dehydrogenase small subunit